MFNVYKNYFIFFHPLGIIAPFIGLIYGIKENGFVMEGNAEIIIGCVLCIIFWGSIAVYVFNFYRERFYELWIFWIIFPSIIFGGFYLYELF